MIPDDLDADDNGSMQTCTTCSGYGKVATLTNIDPTMHEWNPPHRPAAMVDCGACGGTGQVPKDAGR